MADTNNTVYTKQQLVTRLKEIDTLPISDRAVSIMLPVQKFLSEIEKDKTPFTTLMNWASVIGLTFQVGAPMNQSKKQIKVNSSNYLEVFKKACDERRSEIVMGGRDREKTFSQILSRTIAQCCSNDDYFNKFFNNRLSFNSVMQMAVGLEINMEVEPSSIIEPALTEEEKQLFGIEEKIRGFCLEKKFPPIWIYNEAKIKKVLEKCSNNIKECMDSFETPLEISTDVIVRPPDGSTSKECYAQIFLFFACSHLHLDRECIIGRITTNKDNFYLKPPTYLNVSEYGGLNNTLEAAISVIKMRVNDIAEYSGASERQIYEYIHLPKDLIARLENNEKLVFEDIVILTATFAIDIFANLETCSQIYRQIEKAIEEYQVLLLECNETINKPIPEPEPPALPVTNELPASEPEQDTTEIPAEPEKNTVDISASEPVKPSTAKTKTKELKKMNKNSTAAKTTAQQIFILTDEHFKKYVLKLNESISKLPKDKSAITLEHTTAIGNCFEGIMAAVYGIEPDMEFTYKKHKCKLVSDNGYEIFEATDDTIKNDNSFINEIVRGIAEVKDFETGPFVPVKGDVYFTLNIMSGDIMKCIFGNNPQCDQIAGSPFGIGFFRSEAECKKKIASIPAMK